MEKPKGPLEALRPKLQVVKKSFVWSFWLTALLSLIAWFVHGMISWVHVKLT